MHTLCIALKDVLVCASYPVLRCLCSVPFEVLVEGDKEPLYELTMQDYGRVTEAPVLPFNAYGTLAWARNEFENNSASSQVSVHGCEEWESFASCKRKGWGSFAISGGTWRLPKSAVPKHSGGGTDMPV